MTYPKQKPSTKTVDGETGPRGVTPILTQPPETVDEELTKDDSPLLQTVDEETSPRDATLIPTQPLETMDREPAQDEKRQLRKPKQKQRRKRKGNELIV